jgi:hypothetical protein
MERGGGAGVQKVKVDRQIFSTTNNNEIKNSNKKRKGDLSYD